eukprot:TRINITY_DN10754_c0_g1_i3.p1 TRINITY_DN10754_c0_g1~~TRINITY_DN10754_c0_g1_i3.p1  ORF type:complete len:1194 (+),score=379.51 TRINITY_DN10754_c0_g1_i3:43-3624(+)
MAVNGLIELYDLDLQGERVLVRNKGDVPYNLNGHYAEDLIGNNRSQLFEGITLEPNVAYVLWTAPGYAAASGNVEEGGSNIFFRNRSNGQPRSRPLLNDDGDGIRIITPDKKTLCEVSSLNAGESDPLRDNSINERVPENLAQLQELTTDNLMHALHERFNKNMIYTYVGDILIAMNPYKRFPIYTEAIQHRYRGARSKDLPPHIYAIADRAYAAMVTQQSDQCFVISGESGAGKTESTKFVVNHVMELCRAGNSDLEDKIKQVNPFLEAFGNAKTVMNDNSSRFGKYLELKFDANGSVLGGRMIHYLLEKSRVVKRNDNENTFHIFYNLYAGLANDGGLAKLGLTKPSDHHYLHGVGAPTDDEILNEERYLLEWGDVCESMKFVGFAANDTQMCWRLLAAILHLGDVTFNDIGNDACSLASNDNQMRTIADLLQVGLSDLKNAMLHVVQVTRGETIIKNYTVEHAADNRDAISKAVYTRIFSWIFEMVNELLEGETSGATTRLGMLDIFGFEDFDVNSLEQLCINTTNEQLQNYFNKHIFVMEQEEYLAENIDIARIEFPDNQPTLDLILQKPEGIFAICDEQSHFPKATDLTMTEQFADNLTKHASGAYKTARSNKDLLFHLTHYAGEVTYQTDGFLEKNRDQISADVTKLMQSSGSALLASLFAEAPAPSASRGTSKKRQVTVLSGFKTSLKDLVDRLDRSQPHFIRCLKPNAEKKPGKWTDELVERQLTYSGVLETIKIRKMGYSFRLPFDTFVKRYKLVGYRFHEQPALTSESCSVIADHAGLDDYQLGKTKIFMKFNHAELLGQQAAIQSNALMFLQKVVKGFIARQQHQEKLEEKRRQDALVDSLLSYIDNSCEPVYNGVLQVCQRDKAMAADRAAFNERLRREDQQRKELERAKEAKRQQILADMAANPRSPSSYMEGYRVWMRNEHLDFFVGALPRNWRKAIDPRSGRPYFKDLSTRFTTWVDPRSAQTRPLDPLECKGDELPYGWEEAESEEGERFWINHLSGTHHRDHPRELVKEHKARLAEVEEKHQQMSQAMKTEIAMLRTKRTRIQQELAEAVDDDERSRIQARVDAASQQVHKAQTKLRGVQAASKLLLRSFVKDTAFMMAVDKEQVAKKFGNRWLDMVSCLLIRLKSSIIPNFVIQLGPSPTPERLVDTPSIFPSFKSTAKPFSPMLFLFPCIHALV